jgi:hypothetical protein
MTHRTVLAKPISIVAKHRNGPTKTITVSAITSLCALALIWLHQSEQVATSPNPPTPMHNLLHQAKVVGMNRAALTFRF